MSVKAFEILLVAENLKLKIQCIEASGNDLFLGSNDSGLLHYLIEERSDLKTDEVFYSSKLLGQKNLGAKKPVTQMKVATALRKLLALCDGNLFLLDSDTMQTFGSGPKMKNVSVFCINENPDAVDPFTLQFCVGKRKCLQICALREERISLLKEISVQDPPVNLLMDGSYVCVAGVLHYSVYNVDSGHCQDLFPCDESLEYPHMKRISKEEFLVMAPGNLGMFVTSAGTSERPPIQWSDGLLAFSYYHPYVITMTNSFIKVYSLIDQQHKQTILFNGGMLMGNFDGQLYVSTDNSIHCLMPQPWTSQVMALLENESIQEAIELTEHSGGAGMTAEKYLQFTQRVFQKSGFIKLAHENFQEAQEFFFNGKIDLREVISMFPGLLPVSSNFMRGQPPLHPFVDMSQAFQGDATKVAKATEFLFSFLITMRNEQEFTIPKWEVDTAIIKLYCKQNSREILYFLDHKDIDCCMEECVEALQSHHMYAALAKLHKYFGEIHKCLQILTQLLREEIKDDSFQGIKEIVDFMIECNDESLLWQYKDIILEASETEGLRMFCQTSIDLDPNKVLKCLLNFPKSRIEYLKHLIEVKESTNEKFHTELSLFYINELLGNSSDNSIKEKYTQELRSLLKNSDLYNCKTVLARVHNTNLLLETAIVYGKLGEHRKALGMLVYDVKDLPAAEDYCIQHSKDMSDEDKSNLYTTLLKIYLSPAPGAAPDDILLAPALEILSLHSSELDLNQVLEILPSDWSVTIVSQYLKGALRNTMSQVRLKKLQNSLMKQENLQKPLMHQQLIEDIGPIHLTANSICCVCEKGFKSCDFSLYPNGVLTHPDCVKDPDVCPLTGHIFKVKSDKIS